MNFDLKVCAVLCASTALAISPPPNPIRASRRWKDPFNDDEKLERTTRRARFQTAIPDFLLRPAPAFSRLERSVRARRPTNGRRLRQAGCIFRH